MIITIDGPAGTGKSTIAHRLAQQLGFRELDTGALYRAVAAGCLVYTVDPHDEEAVRQLLLSHPLHVTFSQPPSYRMGATDVTASLRSQDVVAIVSYIAANRHVRAALLPIQRALGEGRHIVCEGRDMGTTVFPHAERKFYLTASAEVRAQRRYDELREKNMLPPSVTQETIQAQIEARDTLDQSRELSPLRKAADAIEIDTSFLTIEEVLRTLFTFLPNLKTAEGSPLDAPRDR